MLMSLKEIEVILVMLPPKKTFKKDYHRAINLNKFCSEKKQLFSWEIISENVVVKYLDKSAYNQGTARPVNLYSFLKFYQYCFYQEEEQMLKSLYKKKALLL